jgi:hypothetical protein
MSEAISRGTKAGMRRWYLLHVPRCRVPGCHTYLVRSAFQAVRRCSKHSTKCTTCNGLGYDLKHHVPCSMCGGPGRIAI